jgi:hypothetical protein
LESCDERSELYYQSKLFRAQQHSYGTGDWYTKPPRQSPDVARHRLLSEVSEHCVCELLAFAYSAQGQALLEGFNFFRIQNAAAMPDHVPLFGLELEHREQLGSLLKGKGLDVE